MSSETAAVAGRATQIPLPPADAPRVRRNTATPSRHRRPRARYGIVAGAALLALVATSCNLPVHQWVPDLNHDGVIDEGEIAHQQQVIARGLQAIEAQRRAVQAHPFLTCVRAAESDRSGGYAAQNPYSSASGAYQFLDSTWRTVSVRAGYPGYARAVHAPWWVQDAVALWLYQNGGRSAWAGTGC